MKYLFYVDVAWEFPNANPILRNVPPNVLATSAEEAIIKAKSKFEKQIAVGFQNLHVLEVKILGGINIE